MPVGPPLPSQPAKVLVRRAAFAAAYHQLAVGWRLLCAANGATAASGIDGSRQERREKARTNRCHPVAGWVPAPTLRLGQRFGPLKRIDPGKQQPVTSPPTATYRRSIGIVLQSCCHGDASAQPGISYSGAGSTSCWLLVWRSQGRRGHAGAGKREESVPERRARCSAGGRVHIVRNNPPLMLYHPSLDVPTFSSASPSVSDSLSQNASQQPAEWA